MPAVTGTEIAERALRLLNVILPGEAMSGDMGETSLEYLNDWLSEQSQKAMMCPAVARHRFDLTANMGGLDDPFTIGDGADFDIVKPPNQNSIVGANLILTASSPEVRVPLGLFTDQGYDANQIPDLMNTQPTGLYYQPFDASRSDDYGLVYVWPVQNVSTNDIELFVQQALLQFADLSTTYYVPDGVPRMLKYNLASTMQVEFGKDLSAKAERIAVSSLGTFKRANTKLSDLMNDAYMFTYGRRTLYNILTGSGG